MSTVSRLLRATPNGMCFMLPPVASSPGRDRGACRRSLELGPPLPWICRHPLSSLSSQRRRVGSASSYSRRRSSTISWAPCWRPSFRHGTLPLSCGLGSPQVLALAHPVSPVLTSPSSERALGNSPSLCSFFLLFPGGSAWSPRWTGLVLVGSPSSRLYRQSSPASAFNATLRAGLTGACFSRLLWSRHLFADSLQARVHFPSSASISEVVVFELSLYFTGIDCGAFGLLFSALLKWCSGPEQLT